MNTLQLERQLRAYQPNLKYIFRNSVEFDQKTKSEVWNPEIKFENALKYEQTKPYGGDSTFVFWLVYGTSSYEMHYGEEFQITFHCQFHLATYPFDSHECLLYFSDERYSGAHISWHKCIFSPFLSLRRTAWRP